MRRGFAHKRTFILGQINHFGESSRNHPNFCERGLLLAAQGAVQAALKEEGGAHTLLRGAGNTAEGFEVYRANFCILFFPDLCSTSKDHSFFEKEFIDQSNTIYKGIVFMKTLL